MSSYYVTIPGTLSLSVTVEADSEEEAIEKALDVGLQLKVESQDPMEPEILDFELHHKVVQGGVFYGVQGEALAQLDYED